MKLERTEFGSITIDGKTINHDVVIRMSGDVIKRKKKLSSKKYGTSHKISRKEAKFVYEEGCTTLFLGTGQNDSVVLSKKARAWFDKHHCHVIAKATPEAIGAFNKSRARKAGLFHVTC